jgi:hypothetical protein
MVSVALGVTAVAGQTVFGRSWTLSSSLKRQTVSKTVLLSILSSFAMKQQEFSFSKNCLSEYDGFLMMAFKGK